MATIGIHLNVAAPTRVYIKATVRLSEQRSESEPQPRKIWRCHVRSTTEFHKHGRFTKGKTVLIERRGEVNGINLGWVETNSFVFWYQWDYLRSPAKNWTFWPWVPKIGHEIWKGTKWCPIPSEVGLWLLELWTWWWCWLKLMRFLHQLLNGGTGNMLKLGFVTIGTPHCGMWIRSCIDHRPSSWWPTYTRHEKWVSLKMEGTPNWRI